MPQTHTLGRGLFWHKIRLVKNCPRYHRYATYEYEPPSRASYSHVFRIFRRFGIVVGRWHSFLDEDMAAMEAVKGRVAAPGVVGDSGVSIEDHRAQSYARARVELEEQQRARRKVVLVTGPGDFTFVAYDGDGPEPATSNMAALE